MTIKMLSPEVSTTEGLGRRRPGLNASLLDLQSAMFYRMIPSAYHFTARLYGTQQMPFEKHLHRQLMNDLLIAGRATCHREWKQIKSECEYEADTVPS